MQVAPITVISSDYALRHYRQIAASPDYICYGLRQGHVRVLCRAAPIRSLLKGHRQAITDLRFLPGSEAGDHLLASGGQDGQLFVWRLGINEAGEEFEGWMLLHATFATPQGLFCGGGLCMLPSVSLSMLRGMLCCRLVVITVVDAVNARCGACLQARRPRSSARPALCQPAASTASPPSPHPRRLLPSLLASLQPAPSASCPFCSLPSLSADPSADPSLHPSLLTPRPPPGSCWPGSPSTC